MGITDQDSEEFKNLDGLLASFDGASNAA